MTVRVSTRAAVIDEIAGGTSMVIAGPTSQWHGIRRAPHAVALVSQATSDRGMFWPIPADAAHMRSVRNSWYFPAVEQAISSDRV